TAIVKMLSDNTAEKEIFWWMRNEDAITHIRDYKHNPSYLSAVELKLKPENVSSDLAYIIAQANYIVLNVPAAFLKDTLAEISPAQLKGKKIVSAIKGIVPQDNLIIGDFLHEKYRLPYEDIVV